MKNSGDKHVIVWVAVTATKPSSRWFKKMYNTESWRENPLESERAHVERTDKFSEAYVFDSFEEAHKVYDSPSIKKVFGGKPFIYYYSDKDYFKELLRRE